MEPNNEGNEIEPVTEIEPATESSMEIEPAASEYSGEDLVLRFFDEVLFMVTAAPAYNIETRTSSSQFIRFISWEFIDFISEEYVGSVHLNGYFHLIFNIVYLFCPPNKPLFPPPLDYYVSFDCLFCFMPLVLYYYINYLSFVFSEEDITWIRRESRLLHAISEDADEVNELSARLNARASELLDLSTLVG